jgi:gliding motility-associated-like protein
VKLTATNTSGCPTTDTQVNLITVQPPPAVSFYAPDTAICSIGGMATFISTTTGTTPFFYTWYFGDGTSSTSASPATHAYMSTGMFTVKLVATDGNGCTDSMKRVNYIRVRTITASATVPSSACQGSTVVVSSTPLTTPGATLNWDFGDGTPLVSGSPATHNYTTSGTFTIRLLATVGGCTDTNSNTILINPRPNTSFTFSPLQPCPAPVTVTFTNTTNPSLTGNCNWDFGDGFTSSSTSTSHTYSFDSIFHVKLTVVSPAGCSAFNTQIVNIYPGHLSILDTSRWPNPRIIAGCFPVTAYFTDSAWQPWSPPKCMSPFCPGYPYPIVSRTWNFGDGSSTSTAAKPIHTYANPGTYYCTEVATTSNGCTFYDTLDVHVGGHSTVNFYAIPNPACAGSLVMFYDSSYSQYGPITAWYWDYGDSTNYGIGNPSYNIYKKPGTYSVKLIVSQNGCKDSLTKINYMTIKDPASIPKFTVDCNTLGLVHFVDSSIGATSILWHFGDGTTSTTSNLNHTYAGPGVYIGSLVAWNSNTGCKDSSSFAVIISNLNVDMSATDSTICFGDTTQLSPVITGFVASPNATLQSIKWGVSTGTALPPCCNQSATFIGSTRGQFNIGLTVTDINGCVFKKVRNNFITVGGPIAHFKATPPIGCAPALITFTDTSVYASGTTPASIYWDFGDGTNATTIFPAINHSYPKTGSYGITIKVKDNIGCTDTLGIPNYLLISRPTAAFSTLGSAACAGTPYTFYNASTGNNLTYQWDFGDGTTSTAFGPSHVYVNPGNYTVRLIVTDGVGCKDTLTKLSGVTVAPHPSASFTMNDTITVCPPLIVNFTNTSAGALSYNWNFGNNVTSTVTNPTYTYTSPGLYTVRLIATNSYGCNDTAYARARVLGYKGVLSYSPLKGCEPLTVHFQANNVTGVAGFIYDFGDGATVPTTATSITHTYTKAGPFVPKVTMTDNIGCSAVSVGIDTIKVDGVIAGFTFSPFPGCDKGTVQFTDTSKGSYSKLNPVIWKFHDGTISTAANPTMTYPGPGSYPVTLYGSTTTGCKDTFTRNVVFYKLPIIQAGEDTTICVTDSIVLKPRGGVSYVWSPAASLSCANCTNPFAFPVVQTTYTVVGTDTNGCTNRDTLVIGVKYKTITNVTGSGEICAGDTVQFTAVGATVYHWTPPTGLSNPDTSHPYAFPIVDQHYVLISRLAGCIPDTDYVDLVVHPTPTVDAGASQTMIAGSTLHLEAIASGATVIKWLWSPSEGLFSPTQPATDATPKRTTLYTITVKTEYGCTATDTVRIVVLCDNSQVYLPNTFTPDGNGVNDIFYPRGKGIANINHFRIYDRWGELVFERSNIAVDDKNNGWDGKKGGRMLSPDIYVYTVEATCDTGDPIKWQGDVMLLR